MNAVLPIILIAALFLGMLLIRVVILLVLRSGETSRVARTNQPPPTVITFDSRLDQ
ncbi:MAG: hypothetical protein R3B57_11590 [Phycisphaerales bacterium]